MEQGLKQLALKYAGDPDAESVQRQSAEEILNFRNYAAYYGYVFLVMAVQEIAAGH